jgi:hypothetical protein
VLGERSQPLERAARRGRAGPDLRRSDRSVHAGGGALLLGILAAALTVAAYAPGLDRGMGFDSAATVGYFVDTPSVLDAFLRQVELNNQPLFSFLERLVIFATHNRSEVVLRALPIMAAAAAVGLLVAATARRHGLLAGATAGVITGANALVAYFSREVRGYSLLMLAAVAATLLLYRLLDLDVDSHARAWHVAGYCLAVALGFGLHLYMAFVLLAHAGIVLGRRRLGWRWARRWAAGLALGLAPWAGIARQMLAHPGRGRGFLPDLPGDVGVALLGGYPTVSKPGLLLLLAVLLAGAWVVRGRRDVLAAAAVVAVAFLLLWLVVQPRDTYPRFFIWATPALAWLAAVAVGRWRWLALPAVAGSLLLLHASGVSFVKEGWTFRDAAAYVDAVAESGGRACMLPIVGTPLRPILGYTNNFVEVQTVADLARCDLVAYPYPSGRGSLLLKAVRNRSTFPVQIRLPGTVPGFVAARRPVTPLPGPAIGSRPGQLDAWHER